MKLTTALYLVNTMLFLFVLWKQFWIIAHSPINDERIITKVLMFVFCMSSLSGMWLGYFGIHYAAWFFFLVAVLAAVENYREK